MKTAAFAAVSLVASISASSAQVYVSGGNTLSLYSESGSLLQTFASDLADARGVTVDPSGNVYVADYGSALGLGSIRKYDSSGAFLGNVLTSSYYAGASPIALGWSLSLNGLITTMNINPTPAGGGAVGAIAVLNPNSTDATLAVNGSVGTDYFGVAGVQKSTGDVIYANANIVAGPDGFYQIFDGTTAAYSGSNYGTSYSPTGPNSGFAGIIAGVAVKDDGIGDNDLAFVASPTANLLQQVDNTGAVTSLVSSGLNQPTGVAYSPASDTLFVANFGDGSISQYDLFGSQVGSSFTVPTGATYVAMVPEPSTMALAGMGLAAALWFAKRRRR